MPRLPAPGDIVHATETWQEAGGGGAVAVVQLAKLAGGADFFTALGNDVLARRSKERLEAHGVRVHGAARDVPQRRCFTHIDGEGERTITVLGERIVPHGEDPLPWEELARIDGVFFTGGDDGALRAARRARALVATPRADEALLSAGVQLDALVRSGSDAGEQLDPALLDPPPPASSQVSVACTTSPAAGSRSTRANSIHSTWPTTATRVMPAAGPRRTPACPRRSPRGRGNRAVRRPSRPRRTRAARRRRATRR